MIKQKIQDIIIKEEPQPRIPKIISKLPEKKYVKKFLGKFSRGKFVFGILVFFLLAILGGKTLNAFSKVIIQVVFHQEKINVDTVLKAGSAAFSDLPLETMGLQTTEQKTMLASGIKTVADKASGQIVVYNAYSSSPQTLIATTRFETPDGKTYRINKSIIVPGAKIEGGEILPSSIETTVYADTAGEDYNIDLTDFTIPGFKGGPRYEKFYARSKTAMTGGFEGEVPVVSKEDSEKIQEELESAIRKNLIKEALLQKPEGFLLYENAIQVTFSVDKSQKEPEIRDGKPIFALEETGRLFAPLFSKKDFSNALVKKYLGEEFQEKVEVRNLENLTFELISLDVEKETLIFKIKGEAKFVWIIEEEKLKEALIASSKDLESVFESYPAIDHAAIVFKPSWWRFFPDKTSKIRIEFMTP